MNTPRMKHGELENRGIRGLRILSDIAVMGMKGCLLQSICLMILGRPFILPPTKYVLIKYVEQYIHEQFKGDLLDYLNDFGISFIL
ncbi:hypothetical protein HanRHA438_Chr02g0049961 [Helianthus annuus]|uniref:Uncharacterized protein n=1 Tax=Helianthus annuus TaxID=4232 RepID=A0A251VFZ3_HELAN|nr:hypothetical protein HanXRQr2_Chr02g0048811 [Helianthus annuus]KAJ0938448.1 hypothetical protein HanRHA438_Chr02g0049961 [Helianthus annuus]KAJ0950439.1 hypothetical protein HanPSC8_Chr02g0048281 [Helianthus annuus]